MMVDRQQYSSHVRYKFIVLGGLLLAVALGWGLTRRFALDALFFFALSLALIAWSLYAMLSRVEITADRIILLTPLRANRQVEFRQLISVSENGRFNPVLTLLYHPRRADNLLDLDDAHSLILPAVHEQATLLALLEARSPR